MKGVNQKVVRTVTAFLACIILVEVVYFAIDEQLQASFTPILISMQTIFRSEMDDYATDPDIPPYNSSDVTDELKVSLSKAANQEKTVIITTLNAAWAQKNSMVDLFLKSFHIGNGTEALLNGTEDSCMFAPMKRQLIFSTFGIDLRKIIAVKMSNKC
ncbi:uncharacterized protein LOC131073444 [Cryptomeria japonica]|uniref:uncharacterized protein LOC131073444 n=1 Tax=Cryptomeria japonica TaxID=3369 RepID=UPI0027DA16F4|nr:uncharacterized protein LOC131073444 [Cryptomeria japonica]